MRNKLFDRKPIGETIRGRISKKLRIEKSQQRHGVTGQMIANQIIDNTRGKIDRLTRKKLARFNTDDERNW